MAAGKLCKRLELTYLARWLIIFTEQADIYVITSAYEFYFSNG